MRVYNFLAAHWAEDDLAKGRIKISRFDDLNDPFELLAAQLRSKDVRKAFGALRDHMCANRGVLCFSRGWHNPLLWSHYGDKHRGICLGFDVPDAHIVHVSYNSNRLLAAASKLLGGGPGAQALMSTLLRTKYLDWKYENEVRVFTTLDDVDAATGHYFKGFGLDMQLREMILGARFSGSAAAIAAVARKRNPRISIIQSRLAFKSFRVVRNRSKIVP